MNVAFMVISLISVILPNNFSYTLAVLQLDDSQYTINSVLKKVSLSEQIPNSNFNTAIISETFEVEFKVKGLSNHHGNYRIHRFKNLEYVYRINLIANQGVLVTKYYTEELNDEWLNINYELFIVDAPNTNKCQLTLTYLVENFVKDLGDGYNEIKYPIDLNSLPKCDTYIYITKNDDMRASTLQLNKNSANFTCNDYYFNEVLNTTSVICSMEYVRSDPGNVSPNIAVISLKFPLRFKGQTSKSFFMQFSISFIVRVSIIAIISIALLVYFTGYIMTNEKDFHHYVVLSHQLTVLKSYINNHENDEEVEDLLKSKQGKAM